MTTIKRHKTNTSATTLSFPSTLSAEAEKGQNHVRFEIHELQNGARKNPYIIHLFPPIGLNTSDTGNYNSLDRGAMGAGMDAVLQSIGIKSQEQTGLTGADMKALAAANTHIFSGIPGIDQIERGARITAMERGIAQNPHTSVTYEGHQLRTFQFDFKMISESSAEANTIKEIIDVLRNYSMPESTGALSIQYPAHFEIDFYQGEEINPFMPRITTCHLTGLQVVYNQTTNIFHPDGAPVETDVTLNFQEIKTLVRQDLYGEDYAGIDDKFKIVEPPTQTDPNATTETVDTETPGG